jgi:hypothetical protein
MVDHALSFADEAFERVGRNEFNVHAQAGGALDGTVDLSF